MRSLRGTMIGSAWVLALGACSSNATGTDPGTGSGTLLVAARANFDTQGAAADVRVTVSKAGVPITTATVTADSNLGAVTMVSQGDGTYDGAQPGWGFYYHITVTSGADDLQGSITTPDAVALTEPAPAMAFDPHLAPNGVVHVVWAGDTAQSVDVKTKNFHYAGPDTGALDIPATEFTDTAEELDIARHQATALAGGLPGSTLESNYRARVTLVVTNPFKN